MLEMFLSTAKVNVPFSGLDYFHSPVNLYLCFALSNVPTPFALPYLSSPSNSHF